MKLTRYFPKSKNLNHAKFSNTWNDDDEAEENFYDEEVENFVNFEVVVAF